MLDLAVKGWNWAKGSKLRMILAFILSLLLGFAIVLYYYLTTFYEPNDRRTVMSSWILNIWDFIGLSIDWLQTYWLLIISVIIIISLSAIILTIIVFWSMEISLKAKREIKSLETTNKELVNEIETVNNKIAKEREAIKVTREFSDKIINADRERFEEDRAKLIMALRSLNDAYEKATHTKRLSTKMETTSSASAHLSVEKRGSIEHLLKLSPEESHDLAIKVAKEAGVEL